MVVLMPLSPLQFVRFSLVGIKVFSLPPLLFSPLSPPAPLAFSIRHRKKEKKRFTVVVPSRIFFFLVEKKIQGLFVYFYYYQSSFLCRKTNRPERHKLSVKAMKLLRLEQREAGLRPAVSLPVGAGFLVWQCGRNGTPPFCLLWLGVVSEMAAPLWRLVHVPRAKLLLQIEAFSGWPFLGSDWLWSTFSHCNEIPWSWIVSQLCPTLTFSS